jgi:hypothetical protein
MKNGWKCDAGATRCRARATAVPLCPMLDWARCILTNGLRPSRGRHGVCHFQLRKGH